MWILIILLIISAAINYFDRITLSTAGPLLTIDLNLSPAQLGILFSAFFWSYALFQILAGWLVDRYNANILLAAGFLVWSLSTTLVGFVNSFVSLILLRVLLGIGESVAYPCYSKIMTGSFAEHQRGLANALIDTSTKFGPALGILVGGVLMAHFGWRPVFIFLGIGSLLWLPLWFRWMPKTDNKASNNINKKIGLRHILSKRAFWATFIGHFCGNYFWYFLLTWLPLYLVKERNFSLETMSIVGAIAFFLTGISTTITGWIADRAIASGSTPTRIRKTCLITGLSLATIIVFVVVIPGSVASMVFLLLSCCSYGIFASSHWAVTQTIAGPEAVGRWSGFQNCLANLAGVIAPALTGFVVDRTGQFFWAFIVSTSVVLIGAGIYAFLLGPIEQVKWHSGSHIQNY